MLPSATQPSASPRAKSTGHPRPQLQLPYTACFIAHSINDHPWPLLQPASPTYSVNGPPAAAATAMLPSLSASFTAHQVNGPLAATTTFTAAPSRTQSTGHPRPQPQLQAPSQPQQPAYHLPARQVTEPPTADKQLHAATGQPPASPPAKSTCHMRPSKLPAVDKHRAQPPKTS